MTDSKDIAARMYPTQAAPQDSIAPAAAPAEGAPQKGAQGVSGERDLSAPHTSHAPADASAREAESDEISADDLVNAELSLGERMYQDGGQVLDDAAQYEGAVLGAAFDPLLQQVRTDGDPEDLAAVTEGRAAAADLMAEWRVPKHVGVEVTGELAEWNGRLMRGEPLDDDALDAMAVSTQATLRQEWGREYGARIALAQRAYQEATQRLPWLADVIDAGAGNSPKLIRHFAEIGLRNARRAKR